MRLIEKQIQKLQALDVPAYKESDFGEFWAEAVSKVEGVRLEVSDDIIGYPLAGVEVHDLRFAGLDGTPVAAWYLRPTQVAEPCPVVVQLHGGNGSRGRPVDHAKWLLAGYAVVTMDFRQQGGTTGSRTPMDRCGNSHWICGNLEQPHNHYLYHAWTDALLSVRVAETRPEVRADQVIVSGSSQGRRHGNGRCGSQSQSCVVPGKRPELLLVGEAGPGQNRVCGHDCGVPAPLPRCGRVCVPNIELLRCPPLRGPDPLSVPGFVWTEGYVNSARLRVRRLQQGGLGEADRSLPVRRT